MLSTIRGLNLRLLIEPAAHLVEDVVLADLQAFTVPALVARRFIWALREAHEVRAGIHFLSLLATDGTRDGNNFPSSPTIEADAAEAVEEHREESQPPARLPLAATDDTEACEEPRAGSHPPPRGRVME